MLSKMDLRKSTWEGKEIFIFFRVIRREIEPHLTLKNTHLLAESIKTK